MPLRHLILIITFVGALTTTKSQSISHERGGEYKIVNQTCISVEEADSIKLRLDATAKTLGLKPNVATREKLLFSHPMKLVDSINFYNGFGISNYVDHDERTLGNSNGEGNLDYNCGNRTYDFTNGYNHTGTDYFTWPFGWYMYKHDAVHAVAAEAGIIVGKDDGNFDMNCTCVGNWNAVYLRHTDGSTSWYGHLKRFSLTDKSIGAQVDKGEYLGVVASSGCSTGPHLHFELYDDNGDLVDPYLGDCNETTDTSSWAKQEDYKVPQINALFTHDKDPKFGCPLSYEEPNIEERFTLNDVVIAGIYLRDQRLSTTAVLSIIDPYGEIYLQFNKQFQYDYLASYWYYDIDIDSEKEGEWTFKVRYLGTSYEKPFYRYADADQDGYLSDVDCDDNNPNVNPDAEEIADNGVDDNCDGDELQTSVGEIKTINISTFPNPAKNHIYINGIDISDYQFIAVDIFGTQHILPTERNMLRTDELYNGVYFIKCISKDGKNVYNTSISIIK